MNARLEKFSMHVATSADEPTLWQMLMYAAHETSAAAVSANPDLARYVEGWGRKGDVGVIAEAFLPVGAAWLRLLPYHNRGYGYVADDIPELAIAVLPTFRGQGIGTDLLKAVISAAQTQFPAISLSIRADNPALRLYERCGFVLINESQVRNRTGGLSFTMVHRF